jgi:hypothetical protein
MIGIEKEIAEISQQTDLLRRAIYNCLMAAVKDRNDALAEAYFTEFRGLLRHISMMTEDAQRKRDQLMSGD